MGWIHYLKYEIYCMINETWGECFYLCSSQFENVKKHFVGMNYLFNITFSFRKKDNLYGDMALTPRSNENSYLVTVPEKDSGHVFGKW